MQKIIGIKSGAILALNTDQFYRELLYYDKFLFHESVIHNLANFSNSDKKFDNLVKWLIKNNSLISLSSKAFDNEGALEVGDKLLLKELKKRTKEYDQALNKVHEDFFNHYPSFLKPDQIVTPLNEEFELEEVKVRLSADLCVKLNLSIEVYPISYSLFKNKFSVNKKKEVIKMVVDSFPLPPDNISLEQIQEYKEDPDTRYKFLALKNWINKISKSPSPINEIQDEFDYLIEEYKKNYSIHKLKYSKGTLQIITETSLEAIENISRLRFSKLSQAFFKMEQIMIEYLEGEQQLEGREIAYIVKAQEKITG